jgi:hypothetical protein
VGNKLRVLFPDLNCVIDGHTVIISLRCALRAA